MAGSMSCGSLLTACGITNLSLHFAEAFLYFTRGFVGHAFFVQPLVSGGLGDFLFRLTFNLLERSL